MLKGGSLTNFRGGSSGAPAAVAPSAGSGAMVDSQLYASLMPQVPVYDSSVASVEFRRINPVSDPLTTNQISFSIPATSEQGVFYNLNESMIRAIFNNGFTGGTGASSGNFHPFCGSGALWDNISIEINGVPVNDSGTSGGMLHQFNQFHKLLFLSERNPIPDGMTYNGSIGPTTAFLSDFEDKIFTQLDASPPLITSGISYTGTHPLPNGPLYGQQAVLAPYQVFRSSQSAAVCAVDLPKVHPCLQKGVFLPGWATIRIILNKNTVTSFPQAAIVQDLTRTDLTYVPVMTELQCYIKTIRLTNAGLELWAQLNRGAGGILRYPILHNRVSRFDIPAGTSQIDRTLSVSTLTPQVCVVHLLDRATVLATGGGPYENPLMTPIMLVDETTAKGQNPTPDIQPTSFYLEVGGVRQPVNYARTRGFANRNMAAPGTSKIDYEDYKKAFGEGEPFMSQAAFNDGNWNIHVFNLSGDKLIGHKNPRRTMASISFHCTLATPTVTDGAMVVSFLSMEEWAIEQASGRVSTSW